MESINTGRARLATVQEFEKTNQSQILPHMFVSLCSISRAKPTLCDVVQALSRSDLILKCESFRISELQAHELLSDIATC